MARALSAASDNSGHCSSAQSVKELRNPCGTAGTPSRRNNTVNVISDIAFPPGIAGKTSPSGPVSPYASVKISIAMSGRGTRCTLLAFILTAGISQVCLSQMISPQLA